MVDAHRYTNPHELVRHELAQRREAGYDTDEVVEAIAAAGGVDGLDAQAARHWFDALGSTTPRRGWSYVEPSGLDSILDELPGLDEPADEVPGGRPLDRSTLESKISGAWRGRCAGNCLGKPVERGDTWTRATLRTYLESTDNYPMRTFVSADGELPPGMRLVGRTDETTLGHITRVPRDDDLDYTLLGVALLEQHGADLTTQDVADGWLTSLPYIAACTAERAAYRNLVMGVPVEIAASVDNPYREWIGALIRADVFGYAFPGRPLSAAKLSWQDARLSHRANGIYAEMWAAAFVAAAFTAPTLEQAYASALHVVPTRSRLAEALVWVGGLCRESGDWELIMDQIEQRYGHLHWVHAINNAATISAAVLTSGDDFTTAIGHTVASGLDTDSNGATVGSIMGAFLGDAGVAASWTDDFHDTISTALGGPAFSDLRISGLVERTVALATANAPLHATSSTPTR